MKRTRKKQASELFLALQEINDRIEAANSLFNTTTDETLLDACTYELKYLRLRHAYLLRLARQDAQRAKAPEPVSAAEPVPAANPLKT